MYYKDNNRLWYLLARRTAREILPEEEVELDKLLQEYPHASFTEEILQHEWNDKYKKYTDKDKEQLLQKHLQRLKEAEALQEISEQDEPEMKQVGKRNGVLRLLTYGSVAAAAIIIVLLVWNKPGKAIVAQQEEEVKFGKQAVTRRGSRTKLVLPDSSTVWLNAGSTLDYPQQFNGKTRDVRLQGEAYFEITKNADQPFFVHTRSFNIKVLGTGFNVRAYPDEDSAVTALVHGSVEVIPTGKKSIFLKPNEKITLPVNIIAEENKKRKHAIAAGGEVMQAPRPMTVIQDSIQVETAWVYNKLAFRKMPLENVAMLLEKWFGADIRFKNGEKKALRFTGVYNDERLEEILLSLEATGSFHYAKDKRGTIWIE